MKYQQWIDRLSLQLPVKFRPSEHMQISSPLPGMEQEHVLEIDQTSWQSDILISLCQAALAERINPLFSTYYFDESATEDSCLIFIQATSPILDVWASDLAMEIDAELMRNEIIQLAETLEPDEEMLDLETLPAIATVLAQIHRYHIDIERNVIEQLSDEYVTYLADLPKEPSLEALEIAAVDVCDILGLPAPELSNNESATVWKLPADMMQRLQEQ